MSHHGKTVHPKHAAVTERMRSMFRMMRGMLDEAEREAEIGQLACKDWKGKPVYRIRCAADFGKGPHDVWLPEYQLWALIDLRHYRCPYHA